MVKEQTDNDQVVIKHSLEEKQVRIELPFFGKSNCQHLDQIFLQSTGCDPVEHWCGLDYSVRRR